MQPLHSENGIWDTTNNFCRTHHGFDEYFGIPYSNDMWPNHPTNKNYYPPLPLIEGDEVVETRS